MANGNDKPIGDEVASNRSILSLGVRALNNILEAIQALTTATESVATATEALEQNNSPSSTVAALPAAGTAGAGARRLVTDANATTFASVVASGGANVVPVYSDGTNWRIG